MIDIMKQNIVRGESMKKNYFGKSMMLVLVLMLVFSMVFTGCNSQPEENQSQVENEQTEPVESQNSSEEEATEPVETEEQRPEPLKSYEPVKYDSGKAYAVSSSRIEATEIGMAILKDGGNAIDSAIGTHFGIMFFEQESTGLGGGGFITIHLAKTNEQVFVDGRETAGEKTTKDMYMDESLDTDKDGNISYFEKGFHPLASGVPGNVAAMELALETYGTMTLEEILENYVIPKAEQGIYVSSKLNRVISGYAFEHLAKYEASKELWLKEDGLPYDEGEVIYADDLINTLQIIADGGSEAFYTGEIAQDIVDAVQANGGILTMNDMASYKAEIIEPVRGSYRGYEIVSSPPPSSGGTIIFEILNIMENFDVQTMGHNSPETLFLLYEAAKYAYADRAAYMADTNFAKVPLDGLTSKEYAKQIADQITIGELTEFEMKDPNDYESRETTHLSVVDKEGNIVAITSSVNGGMGCAMTVPGRGFLMNNELLDFNTTDPTSVNAPEPGKKPLSSMSPTIVIKDGQPVMALGSPGGSTILYTVAQVISNVVDHGMTIEEAVNTSRVSYSTSKGTLSIENGVSQDVVDALTEMGIEVKLRDPGIGAVNAIYVDDDGVHSAADPRRPGHASAE